MTQAPLFDAHNHLQAYPGPGEVFSAVSEAQKAGVKLMLCAGTCPADWPRVAEIAGAWRGVLPAFGLHPWKVPGAAAGWLEALEEALRGSRACVGEIGLDRAVEADYSGQEEAFTAQLRLAKELGRPAVLHCVRAWGRLLEILKKERPPRFMLHSYGGPCEMMPDLAALGGYFSFSGAILDPKREKLRKALLFAPPDRLLFETESPEPDGPGWRSGPAGLAEVMAGAALQLEREPGDLAALAWRNARNFLGELFPD